MWKILALVICFVCVETRLVVYHSFDSGYNGVGRACDEDALSASQMTATATGVTTSGSSGSAGLQSSAQFSAASNSRLLLGTWDMTSAFGTGQLTVAAWATVPNTLLSTTTKIVVAKASASSPAALLWGLTFEPALLGVTARFSVLSGTVLKSVSSAVLTAGAGTWVHLAGVYDGAQLRVYVNGVQAGSPVDASSGLQECPSGVCNHPIVVGNFGDGLPYALLTTTSQYGLTGSVDDIQFYDEALSASSIAGIYAHKATIQAPKLATVANGTTVNAVVGQEFSLQSTLLSGNASSIEYTWGAGDGCADVAFTNGSTQFANVSLTMLHDGLYRLFVVAEDGRLCDKATVAVRSTGTSPSFQATLQNTSVVLGSSETLYVSATGYPSPDVHWQLSKNDSVTLIVNGTVTNTTLLSWLDVGEGSSLTLSNVTDGTSLYFRVLAANKYGSSTSFYRVNILPPPPEDSSTTSTSSSTGSTSSIGGGGGGGGGGDSAVGADSSASSESSAPWYAIFAAAAGSAGLLVLLCVVCAGLLCCLTLLLILCGVGLCVILLVALLAASGIVLGGGGSAATTLALKLRAGGQSDDVASYRELEWDELEFGEPIGSGQYGTVYWGSWRGAAVAIKVLNMEFSEDSLALLRREATLQSYLGNHPNVVPFVGAVTTPHHCAMVTPYMERGSLYDLLIRRRERVAPAALMRMMAGAAAGLLHLHREGVVHRDVAARNILVGDGDSVYVADFGLSQFAPQEEDQDSGTSTAASSPSTSTASLLLDSPREGGGDSAGKMSSNRSVSEKKLHMKVRSRVGESKGESAGPIRWMAPESLERNEHTPMSDVWMYGVTLYECCARDTPYAGCTLHEVYRGVLGGTLRLSCPDAPALLQRILQGCLVPDPAERLTMAEICEIFHRENLLDSSNFSPQSDPSPLSPLSASLPFKPFVGGIYQSAQLTSGNLLEDIVDP